MIVKALAVSMFATNCYLAGCPDTGEAAVIDPGGEGKRIAREIENLGLSVKYIVNTHGHVDHIGANAYIREISGAPILLHKNDLDVYRNPGFGLGLAVKKQPPPDRFIREGERVVFGRLALTVLETPGHTPGGVSLLLDQAVFTGDTLFAGSIGRTDLRGGSFDQIMRSIKERLLVLPPGTKIYPGHGPASTIGEEKQSNPFVLF